jgi:hypothetical protein
VPHLRKTTDKRELNFTMYHKVCLKP